MTDVDPTLVISIDEGGPYPVLGADGPLVFYGSLGTGDYGITRFREPAYDPDVTYADRAGNQHGSTATGWSYPDILHDWDFVTDQADSETTSRAQVALVRAFLGRLKYAITITVAGAPAETWSCKPGACKPTGDRTINDLGDSNPVFNIVIPAHPIRSL